MTGELIISSHLLAQLVEEHMPWPNGTVIRPQEEVEGTHMMRFYVSHDDVLDGETVAPVFRRSEDGSVEFMGWSP